MKLIKTEFDGLVIIEPDIYYDDRGYYFESYNYNKYKDIGDINFIQDSESYSKYGVIRGLHYQKPPYTQSKLVRVIKGRVLDVVVDIRTDSPTFGKYYSIILSDENKRQLFVPRGFAHGFITLSEDVIFNYKVDNIYNPKSEAGIIYNDINLNIDWLIKDHVIINDKDNNLLNFQYNIYYKNDEYLRNG